MMLYYFTFKLVTPLSANAVTAGAFDNDKTLARNNAKYLLAFFIPITSFYLIVKEHIKV